MQASLKDAIFDVYLVMLYGYIKHAERHFLVCGLIVL